MAELVVPRSIPIVFATSVLQSLELVLQTLLQCIRLRNLSRRVADMSVDVKLSARFACIHARLGGGLRPRDTRCADAHVRLARLRRARRFTRCYAEQGAPLRTPARKGPGHAPRPLSARWLEPYLIFSTLVRAA